MLIVVTDREHSVGDFELRLGEIAKAGPQRIILREKKLDDEEYFALAKRCAGICKAYGVPLALNRWVVERFQTGHLHLPFADFVRAAAGGANQMVCGVSIHNKEEAAMAEELGAAYLVAGHIYETECKKASRGGVLGFCGRFAYQLLSQFMPLAVSLCTTRRTLFAPERRGCASCPG